jgi:hypothetical protein
MFRPLFAALALVCVMALPSHAKPNETREFYTQSNHPKGTVKTRETVGYFVGWVPNGKAILIPGNSRRGKVAKGRYAASRIFAWRRPT